MLAADIPPGQLPQRQDEFGYHPDVAQPELLAFHVTNSGGRIVDDAYREEIERLIAELDRLAAERGL
ncbi:hypothetical protein ACLIMP_21860 [Novosphingobium aerophilum]|uniref:hypothetical protein n=1 Tax=Novosphingobium aerophilum TaxID=2839843 RepID=UPI003FD226B5